MSKLMFNSIMIDILIINQLSKDHIYDNWKKLKETLILSFYHEIINLIHFKRQRNVYMYILQFF